MNKKAVLIFMLALFVLIGLLDTGYLSYKHATRDPLACSIITGCDRVTSSPYSALFGIPLAYLGVTFYAGMLFLLVWYARARKTLMLLFLVIGSALGFLMSLWFLYLQFFVIRAICEYCIVSSITATLMFIGSIMLLNIDHFQQKKVDRNNEK